MVSDFCDEESTLSDLYLTVIEAVSVMSEYPQNVGLVCCCYNYHIDVRLQNFVVRCVLHVIGCVLSDACHTEQEYKIVVVGRRLTASIILCPFITCQSIMNFQLTLSKSMTDLTTLDKAEPISRFQFPSPDSSRIIRISLEHNDICNVYKSILVSRSNVLAVSFITFSKIVLLVSFSTFLDNWIFKHVKKKKKWRRWLWK